ncbi:hypothetical protein Dimus_001144, partial [Dionaea muscipula]
MAIGGPDMVLVEVSAPSSSDFIRQLNPPTMVRPSSPHLVADSTVKSVVGAGCSIADGRDERFPEVVGLEAVVEGHGAGPVLVVSSDVQHGRAASEQQLWPPLQVAAAPWVRGGDSFAGGPASGEVGVDESRSFAYVTGGDWRADVPLHFVPPSVTSDG